MKKVVSLFVSLMLVFSLFGANVYAADKKDFEIEDGILVSYSGNAGNVVIPDGVVGIGSNAFSNSGVISVVLPNSVTSIGGSAFANCSTLTSITIPESVTSIGWCAFIGTGIQDPILLNNVLYYVPYDYESYIIPEGTLEIREFAFGNCKSISSITIPDSVKSIGDFAFISCIMLRTISIPNSVQFVGRRVFPNLAEPVIVNNVLYYVPKDYESYVIPDGTLEIEEYAFDGCESITAVTIPNSVTKIGVQAFARCRKLAEITIPNSVTSIGYYAFWGCSNLTTILLPNSLTELGYSAFEGTNIKDPIIINNILFYVPKNYESYIIPDGTLVISFQAFANCISLTSVLIPDSVTSIDVGAFEGASIKNPIIYKDTLYYVPKNYKSYIIPNNVKTISSGMFSNNYILTSVTIPKSVTSIESFCFRNCDNVVISGHLGSYAHGYAIENEIPFKSLEKTPNIFPITDKEKMIKGKVISGATVKIKINNGSYINAKVTGNSFRYMLNKIYPAGTKIQAIAIKKTLKSKASTIYVKPHTPSLKNVKSGSTSISGSATKNAKIYVSANAKKYSGKVTSKGTFMIKVAKINIGTKIKVRSYVGKQYSMYKEISVK